MKAKLLINCALVFAAVASVVPCYAAVQTLNKVETESDEKSSVVTFTFNSKIGFKKPVVEDHKSFLQLSLPDTITDQSGQFFEGKGPYIQKVALFQTAPTKTALRLFVSKDANLLKKSVTVDLLDNRMMLYLDHAPLVKFGIKDHLGVGAAAKEAEKVVAKTEVRHDIPDPVKKLSFGLGKDDADLRSKMIIATFFCGGMLVLLVMTFLVKRLRPRRGGHGPREMAAFEIKTLGSHHLNGKQRLTIVQVAGQKILLGVTPEGISFLTTLDEQKQNLMPTIEPVRAPRPKAVLPETPVAKTAPPAGAAAYKNAARATAAEDGTQKSIEDVTNLIRRKLKHLPKI